MGSEVVDVPVATPDPTITPTQNTYSEPVHHVSRAASTTETFPTLIQHASPTSLSPSATTPLNPSQYLDDTPFTAPAPPTPPAPLTKSLKAPPMTTSARRSLMDALEAVGATGRQAN